MHHAACQVSIAPLRAQPSDKSEMVSQLLFGETVEIDEQKDNWRHVRCTWDGYAGWVDAKQIKSLTASEFELCRSEPAISLSLVEGLMAADHFIPITLGATLPNYDGLRCRLANNHFSFLVR